MLTAYRKRLPAYQLLTKKVSSKHLQAISTHVHHSRQFLIFNLQESGKHYAYCLLLSIRIRIRKHLQTKVYVYVYVSTCKFA